MIDDDFVFSGAFEVDVSCVIESASRRKDGGMEGNFKASRRGDVCPS
jgi:hypothetical protein